MNKEIWTIGHSTRTLAEFVEILQSFQIELLVDIRSFPGSRRYPHFNKETLGPALQQYGIDYKHMVELGGRRKADPNSMNIAWHHPAFRGYADYMQTEAFNQAVTSLEQVAGQRRSCYMCSEAVWWRCHRALVSDYLKAHGWTVWHISDVGKSQEHPYTSPARVEDGRLYYIVSSSGRV